MEVDHSAQPGGKVGAEPTKARPINVNKVIQKAYWGLLPWLFLTATTTYIDRSNVSFASLQFKGDLGLTNADYGLGAGIFYIGYAVFQVPSQLAITRVGAPTWLAFLILCWGTVAACSAAMKNRAQFFAVRFLLGVFEAGCFPGAWYHMTLFLTSLELGVGYAVTSSSTALSNVIGAPLAAGLLYMDGVGGLRGWQWIFIIEGLLTVLYGVVIKLVLAEKPANARWLQPEEQAWLQGRQDRLDEVAHAKDANSGQWWASIVDWKIWYLSVCYALVQFSITAVVYFNPLIVEATFDGTFSGKATHKHFASQRDQAWNTAKIALISSVLWVPVAAGMLFVAWSSKRFAERNLHCAVPSAFAGICFMVVPITVQHNPIGGYVMLILAATGVWSVHGPIWSWPKTFLHGEGAAVGIAIFNSIGAIGGFAGPYVTGSLSGLRGGYHTAMLVLGAINFVLAGLIVVFRPQNLEAEHVSSQHDAALLTVGDRNGGKTPEAKVLA